MATVPEPTDASTLGREDHSAPPLSVLESRTIARIEIGGAPSPPDENCLYISAEGITFGVDVIATF